MITSYKKAKEEVLQYYDDFLKDIELYNIPKDDTSVQSLEIQAEKIKKDQFCMIVAGEAKSGKSTFINAYLNTDILPMDVKQCTSSIIEIEYDNKFSLTATYADGTEEEMFGEDKIAEFLTQNAALDDEYRDIPITSINNEIIIKYQDRKVPNKIIDDLLEGVKEDNIYHLPQEKYNEKIREYIKVKQPHWKDVVIKINIKYPFEDKDMKGIKIIDSPGINAAGTVGYITGEYIESADAIMFLRPLIGEAIEANSFKKFLESKSVDRNKNAMFLILTRAATESEETKQRAIEEFIKMFGDENENGYGIAKEQIIAVDSKVELYHDLFESMTTEEIEAEIKKRRNEQTLEPIIQLAWYDSRSEKEAFINELRRLSNFDAVEQALNRFGRKAHFIELSEFLNRMIKVYNKAAVSMNEKIENYQLKAEDPEKLAEKVTAKKAELTEIENLMNEKIREISNKYVGGGSKGVIEKQANEEMTKFEDSISKIDKDNSHSVEDLEKKSFRQIDKFKEYETKLQNQLKNECDNTLKVVLGEDNNVDFIELQPDFSHELIDKIKADMKKKSNETYYYTTGSSFFKEEHQASRFSQSKYFDNVYGSIDSRIVNIKNDMVRDLKSFVARITSAYKSELQKNAKIKERELEAVKADQRNAEELKDQIKELNELCSTIDPKKNAITELKKGIDNYVS